MFHRAFVFDWNAFERDAAALLAQALRDGNIGPLRDFIERHRGALVDPYEGAPLEADWESLLETRDAHQYGDFVLTRYYDPADDIGLGHEWEKLERILVAQGLGRAPILGQPFESFDPGKMGSYFQTPAAVAEHLEAVQALARAQPNPLLAQLASVLAKAAGTGLYVTF